MKVIEPKESLRPVWDKFVSQSPHGSLTQSWAWADFNQAMGEDCLKLAIVSSQLSSENEDFLAAKSQILGTILLVKRTVKSINYWYAPYGPVLSEFKTEKVFSLLMAGAQQRAKQKGIDFIRLEPKLSLDNYLTIPPVDDTAQAQNTLIVDIDREEREILAQMKSKHRYNIRLSDKKGVKVSRAETVEDIDHFWQLLKQNSIDNNFSIHSKDYYQKQLDILSENDMEILLLAKKDKKVIGANLIGFYGPTAYYLHGAMDREHSNLMASHLLQWRAIQLAKERGCQNYDLFGIAPPDSEKDHPWQGFSRFKKGFAPETKITSYPGAYFLPYNQAKFMLYRSLKRVKNIFDL